MSVKRDTLAFKVPGKVLGTRSLGSQVASEIRERATGTDRDLIVDFAGVQVASSPFLDEIACMLRAWIADHPERFVLLGHLNEDVRDTLSLVLEHRDMSLTQLDGAGLRLLGGREHLEGTLASAQELGVFTAAQLAEQLRLKLPNLHQRLAALQAAGAVVRVNEPGAPKRPVVFATPEVGSLTGRV